MPYEEEKGSFIGTVMIKFEYGFDAIVLDEIPMDDDCEEKSLWVGKTFEDLSSEELNRAFELAFYDQVERPSDISFNVDIEEKFYDKRCNDCPGLPGAIHVLRPDCNHCEAKSRDVAETVEDRVAYIRNMMGCKDRMVNDQVSHKCVGCKCYNADVPTCDIRDEAIQAMNEDAWVAEHDYLDPHPQSESD